MSTIEDQAIPIELEVMGGVSTADNKPRVIIVCVALDVTIIYGPTEARALAKLIEGAADHAEAEAAARPSPATSKIVPS